MTKMLENSRYCQAGIDSQGRQTDKNETGLKEYQAKNNRPKILVQNGQKFIKIGQKLWLKNHVFEKYR